MGKFQSEGLNVISVDNDTNIKLFNKRWTIIFFLLLIVLIGLSIWAVTGDLPKITVHSQGGIWNLRNVDFNKTCVQLSGEVEYVPNALLLPDEFDADSNKRIGIIPNDIPYLTSRVRLLVPNGRFLEVAGFVDDFGSSLYVNGKWLTNSGLPATTPEDNIPSERFLRFTVERRTV